MSNSATHSIALREQQTQGGTLLTSEQAEKLAGLMRRTHGHLKLIPLNRVEGSPLIPGDAKSFADMLKKLGVNVTVRRRLGADIDAACGQLRRKEAT